MPSSLLSQEITRIRRLQTSVQSSLRGLNSLRYISTNLCCCLGADQIRQPGPLCGPRMPVRERHPFAYLWAKKRQSWRQLYVDGKGSGLWGRKESDTTEYVHAHTHTRTTGESRGLFPEEQINTSWHPLHRWGNQDRETQFLAALGAGIPNLNANPHHRGSPPTVIPVLVSGQAGGLENWREKPMWWLEENFKNLRGKVLRGWNCQWKHLLHK